MLVCNINKGTSGTTKFVYNKKKGLCNKKKELATIKIHPQQQNPSFTLLVAAKLLDSKNTLTPPNNCLSPHGACEVQIYQVMRFTTSPSSLGKSLASAQLQLC